MENTNLNNIEFIRSIEEEYSIENMKFSELNLFVVNKIEIYIRGFKGGMLSLFKIIYWIIII